MNDHKIDKESITCGKCGTWFERSVEYRHCSNCFACTGCEIYYCPRCDEEIVLTPMKKRIRTPEPGSGSSLSSG